MLLLSKYVSGSEAEAMGLVNSAVDNARVFETAQEWAATIASYSPWAVARTKELVYNGFHLPLDDAFKWEAEVTAEGYLRPEAAEAYAAFSAQKHKDSQR
jgi:enoyl-CoA hydratase/carnithine racemase